MQKGFFFGQSFLFNYLLKTSVSGVFPAEVERQPSNKVKKIFRNRIEISRTLVSCHMISAHSATHGAAIHLDFTLCLETPGIDRK